MNNQTHTPPMSYSRPAGVPMEPAEPQAVAERRVWMAMRQGMLLIVAAIEDYLAIPKDKSALVARRVN